MAGMALAKTRHPRPKRVGKNSTLGEKTAVRTHSVLASIFGGRTVLKLIGVIAAAVIITSGVLWYKFVYTDPGKVFWGMVNNNLITPSVTKEIHQSGSSTTNIEDTQLALTPTVKVRDIKEISSTSGTASTKIKIESVGTPTDTYQQTTAKYIRYGLKTAALTSTKRSFLTALFMTRFCSEICNPRSAQN
jgi:hypothetical protein